MNDRYSDREQKRRVKQVINDVIIYANFKIKSEKNLVGPKILFELDNRYPN